MKIETFFEKFDLFADAPDAVAKMRELVLELSATGRLVPELLERPIEEDTRLMGSAVELVMGQAPAGDECNTEGRGTVFVKVGEFGPLYPRQEVWTTNPLKFAKNGDVLVCVVGATVGKLNLAIDCAIGRSVAAIRPSEALGTKFLYYSLIPYTLRLRRNSRGSAQGVIGKVELNAVSLWVPSLGVQKRIVAKVDELMAVCDRLEEQLKERDTRHAALSRAALARFAEAPTPANLQYLFHESFAISPADLRKTILTLAVQGKLVPQDPNDEPTSRQLETIHARKAELLQKKVIKKSDPSRPVDAEVLDHSLPDSWAWVRLVDICELITDGTHLTPKYTESGRIFLSAQNVKPFRFLPAKHRFVSEEDYQGYIKNRKPERGDVLLTRVGAGIGEAATVDQDLDFAIYVSLGLIRPVRGFVFSDYITLWLNSPDGTEKSSQSTYGKGVSQGNLNLSLIRNFLVPLPPLAEQRRIVAKVDELMALVDVIETQLATARSTAETLLASAVSEFTDL